MGSSQALTEFIRETLKRVRDTPRRSAEVQATAAELTVIAEDPCARARAERGAGPAEAAISIAWSRSIPPSNYSSLEAATADIPEQSLSQ